MLATIRATSASLKLGRRTLNELRHYHPKVMSGSSSRVVVDLRSDVLSQPTDGMRAAIAAAKVGDDVFLEDPTIIELQNRVATMFAKEAAIFVPSGTMGNLVSILTHCGQRGDECILGDESHIHFYEQGNIAQFGGVHHRVAKTLENGALCLKHIEELIRHHPEDTHYPRTKLICIENTHNRSGGRALQLEYLHQLRALADKYRLAIHLDGARVMNAAVSLNVAPMELTKPVDSVTMCLSKGLGAPCGSVVAGTREFIEHARRMRKALGGAMRQPGFLAAAGIYSLDRAEETVRRDHQTAKIFAESITSAVEESGKQHVNVDLDHVETNIVNIDVLHENCKSEKFCEIAEDENICSIRMLPTSDRRIRLATHWSVTDTHVKLACQKFKYIVQKLAEM